MATPDVFTVVVQTDVVGGEDIEVRVRSSDSPQGAERLHMLVKEGFYDGGAFFRVVPDFIVQFGICPDPSFNEAYATDYIDDEPLVLSNVQWTLSFATSGRNTRSTQLFFNVADNSSKLDERGFTPIGTVTSGFDTLTSVTNPTPGDRYGIDQDEYSNKGNDWIMEEHPDVNTITRVYIK
eukprot:TRINITY_DN8002_c0_g1_i1.p1 TRINITY_DN8002_c0_g1~~TRINITY_DN8002_c0_g1_i1.p1  ORF type:complete len:204 (+),score=58.41 TRINITY_DN8002_c0_g1_i1:74-613(+)